MMTHPNSFKKNAKFHWNRHLRNEDPDTTHGNGSKFQDLLILGKRINTGGGVRRRGNRSSHRLRRRNVLLLLEVKRRRKVGPIRIRELWGSRSWRGWRYRRHSLRDWNLRRFRLRVLWNCSWMKIIGCRTGRFKCWAPRFGAAPEIRRSRCAAARPGGPGRGGFCIYRGEYKNNRNGKTELKKIKK